MRRKERIQQRGGLASTVLKQIDFGFFLKMDHILRTTVDMAVGTAAYSWQENYLEKVLMIQEAGSLPRALAGQRESFRTQCQWFILTPHSSGSAYADREVSFL